MQFGVLLPTRPRYLDMVPAIEAAGYRRVWFQDFQLAGADSFVEMAIRAASAPRLGFGVAVCNPITRHVTVVANTMATLNRHYPGRMELGVAVGEAPLRAIGHRRATVDELDSFVRRCRALMRGQSTEVSDESGPVRFLDSALPALNVEDPIPIRIGAGGPKSLRLAGAVADGVILGNIDPRLLAIQLGYLREGAEAAGRSLAEIDVAVLTGVFAAEPEPSFELLRHHVGGFVPNFLTSNAAAVEGHEDELSPALVTAFRTVAGLRKQAAASAQAATGRKSAVYERYLEAVPAHLDSVINEETIAAKVLFGATSEVDRRLAELRDLGVNTVILFPDPLDDGALATFASRHLAAAQ